MWEFCVSNTVPTLKKLSENTALPKTNLKYKKYLQASEQKKSRKFKSSQVGHKAWKYLQQCHESTDFSSKSIMWILAVIGMKSLWEVTAGSAQALQPFQNTKQGREQKMPLQVLELELTGASPFPWSLSPSASGVPVPVALWFYRMIKCPASLCSPICGPGSLCSEKNHNNAWAEHGAFPVKTPR